MGATEQAKGAAARLTQIAQIDGEDALCFPEVTIDPGTTAEISVVSHDYVLVLGHWELLIAAEGAADLRIVAWGVGDDLWTVPETAIPAAWFTTGSLKGGGFTICKAPAGTRVGLLVANVGRQPRTFRAGLVTRHLQRAR